MKNKSIFKVGDLVFTKDVGYPFNRTDDGSESWEGVSCVVDELNVNRHYIQVKALLPVKTVSGIMETCCFFPEQLRHESRPWLKKNLKTLLSFRKKLQETVEFCNKNLK